MAVAVVAAAITAVGSVEEMKITQTRARVCLLKYNNILQLRAHTGAVEHFWVAPIPVVAVGSEGLISDVMRSAVAGNVAAAVRRVCRNMIFYIHII